MTRVLYTCVALTLAMVGCTSPGPEEMQTGAAASTVPAEVAAVVLAAAPDVDISGGEFGADNIQYEVTGTLPNGNEIEIDMMQSDGEWTVLEIQRDVPWSSVPEPVRATAAAAPDSFEPVRVIESTQAVDGSVVYELFRAAEPGAGPRGPDREVRWYEGNAAILP